MPGKPRLFLSYVNGFKPYSDSCQKIAANGYAGFRLDAAATA